MKTKVNRKFILVIAITLCMFLFIFIRHSLVLRAEFDKSQNADKMYTGVIVYQGDTLSEIAARYYDRNYYGSMNTYIKEICQINGLSNADNVKAGENIIIPYYASK